MHYHIAGEKQADLTLALEGRVSVRRIARSEAELMEEQPPPVDALPS
jgi:hypothetical protein